ncbi:uncharacterized protein LOC120713244 [Panicum virgatum]|uniref:uncharacterized protein LOC120713244 n=1 Tax=Panicum virgatum TaxID=38727 RepID=UPI0019D61BD9|nr:uncharacterized protein LOC120713244 [Panicum virgatum]
MIKENILGNGFHEVGEAGVQLLGQLLGLRDGVPPLLVGRGPPVRQVLPPQATRNSKAIGQATGTHRLGGGLSDGGGEVVEQELLELALVRLHLPPSLLLVHHRLRHLRLLCLPHSV